MAIEHVSLIGGNLCLDFMNTVGDHLTATPSEWLLSYHDLAAWGHHAGALRKSEADGLIHLAGKQPETAETVVEQARAGRETIFRLLLSTIRGEAPDQADMAHFNHLIAALPARTGVDFDGYPYTWRFAKPLHTLDAALWRVLWAAGDLFTSDQLAAVKVCEGDGCGWMFLDTSRNRSRRWCSMADCGNRAKASRFYKRHKDA